MKKETIGIVMCVLLVVTFFAGMFAESVIDLFERDGERGVPSVILYECNNATATWFETNILYGTGSTVYPDSYEIRWSIRNTTTWETTPGEYKYCELRE